MQNRKVPSFKPLQISAEQLPVSMVRQAQISNYATERAQLLFGSYRTGDANDANTYVAAISATLARFPVEVITAVTHPSGLATKYTWLPSVKEVFDTCQEAVEPIKQNEARLKRIKEQMEMRAREDSGEKPTLEHLKEKYGSNWGLTPHEPEKKSTFKAPSWQEISSIYSADPSRLKRLLNTDAAYARGDDEQ